MDKKVHELLNDQVNKELYSAYLYLDMANFYDAKGLDGFANWFEIQAREEQDHAMLIYKYLHNSSEAVTLGAIARPDKALCRAGRPAQGRAGARALRHLAYLRHLRRRRSREGLPHHAVFGLVRGRAGRGGKELPGAAGQVRPVRQGRRRPCTPSTPS